MSLDIQMKKRPSKEHIFLFQIVFLKDSMSYSFEEVGAKMSSIEKFFK